VVNGYVQWNLNTAGLSWIARGGITKLAAREGHDVLDLWPDYASGQADVISAYMSEQSGTSQDPYLKITYTIPTAMPPSSKTAGIAAVKSAAGVVGLPAAPISPVTIANDPTRVFLDPIEILTSHSGQSLLA
jgi:hypothetical protein